MPGGWGRRSCGGVCVCRGVPWRGACGADGLCVRRGCPPPVPYGASPREHRSPGGRGVPPPLPPQERPLGVGVVG
eukprot:8826492-Alexandrium_andersonii.AAC.1